MQFPDDFDYSALEDPGFKEDAVREEIIAPMLRKLGWRATGDVRVERSKNLVHPFVMIGTRRHPVSIIPDYTLFSGDRALMVLDAKHPQEDILENSTHREQAYSYATHPDVRCEHYGLCNGRVLVVFAVSRKDPLLVVPMEEAGARWADIVRYLSVAYLQMPALRQFHPDLGSHLRGLGITSRLALVGLPFESITMVSLDQWTASVSCRLDGVDYMGSLDFGRAILDEILRCLPAEERQRVNLALSRQPFHVYVGGKIRAEVVFTLGEDTLTEFEWIVPLLPAAIRDPAYAADYVHPAGGAEEAGVPEGIYCLGG